MALLQFSDPTTKKGILQQIRKRTNTQNATASSYSDNEITVDVNFALASYFIKANQYAGRWSPVDDINQIDYPIAFAGINAGIQDVVFTVDATGNQVLDIYKIRMKTTVNGDFVTLDNLDLLSDDDQYLNNTTSGVPTGYRLTANGIIFNCVPNFTLANALELYISRGSTYFSATDTTKVAGIPEKFQEYLVLRPSYFYCLNKGMTALARAYYIELYGADGKHGMEKAIADYYANRNRAEKRRIGVLSQNNR